VVVLLREPQRLNLTTFSKIWRKEDDFTGAPYDILAEKAHIFVDVCGTIGIEECEYASVFPRVLTGRARVFFMNQIGGGHNWKTLYEALSRYFDTTTNRSQ
jgi:hypothetical protein